MEKNVFEDNGLIPRSIIRTFDRFRRQLLPGTEKSMLAEFRVSKFQILVSVRCLVKLLLIPFFTNLLVKNFVLLPITQYVWNTYQFEIFLNSYQENRAFLEMERFEEKMFFESLISPPNNFTNLPCAVEPKNDQVNLVDNAIFTGLKPSKVFSTNHAFELFPQVKDKQLSGIFYNSRSIKGATLSTVKLSVNKKELDTSRAKLKTRVRSKEQKLFLIINNSQQPIAKHDALSNKRVVYEPTMYSFLPATRSKNCLANKTCVFLNANSLNVNLSIKTTKYPVTKKLATHWSEKTKWVAWHKVGSRYTCEKASCLGRQNPYLVLKRWSEKGSFASTFVLLHGKDEISRDTGSSRKQHSNSHENSSDVINKHLTQFFVSYKRDRPQEIETDETCSTKQVPQSFEFSSFRTDLFQHPQKFHQKTIEIAIYYNQQSIKAITNLLGDFVTSITIIILFIWVKAEIIILKSFITESIYSFSDTTKSFLLILLINLLVGFHSPRGWEIFIELVLRRFGLPENEIFMFTFVATIPVLLHTVFKYWIFRYLNQISPSTVATYHTMIE